MSLSKILAWLIPVAVIVASGAQSNAAQHFPYRAKITTGDYNTARIVFGDDAAASMPGRDAIPAFRDIAAYEYYYSFADDQTCSDPCVKHAYDALRSQRKLKPIIVGQPVTVYSMRVDPQDKHYSICELTTDSDTRHWYVLCAAVGDMTLPEIMKSIKK